MGRVEEERKGRYQKGEKNELKKKNTRGIDGRTKG